MSIDFVQLANKGIQSLNPYQAGKAIEELERELGIIEIVKLASNENPLGPSPTIKPVIEHQIEHLARYPDANGFILKDALSNFYQVKHQQITLGNGSEDVLGMILEAFSNENSEVITSEYAFIAYKIRTKAKGATLIEVPAKNFGFDTSAIADAISPRTSLIIIANPNNPTGTYIIHDELASLLSRTPENVLVVIDEAYAEYVGVDDYPDSFALMKTYPNLIMTRTFSKAYGLAGLRAGYSISHPDIANVLNRIRQPFNMNVLAMHSATVALSDQAHVEKSKLLNYSEKEKLLSALSDLGYEVIPSLGNFLTIDMRASGVEIFEKLLHQGVIVRPLIPYNMPNHLRVSIGLPEENEKLLAALKSI